MIYFSKENIEEVFSYETFIPFLESYYRKQIVTPQRPHYSIPTSKSTATLLLMPAWQVGGYTGIKIVSVYPDNPTPQIPTVQGLYCLMDANDGRILATFDGTSLTLKRTAAISALASKYLSHADAKRMVMIGTGQLSRELIHAHSAVRFIQHVDIWGRNKEKAHTKAIEVSSFLPEIEIQAITDKDESLSNCDVVSVATFSNSPLVSGHLLKQGAHLDLVGSFTPDMREANDECLVRSSIFVDNYTALNESGDLALPLKNKVIKKSDILMDLTEVIQNGYTRKSPEQNTLFKSVGNAKSDLAIAAFIYESKNEKL